MAGILDDLGVGDAWAYRHHLHVRQVIEVIGTHGFGESHHEPLGAGVYWHAVERLKTQDRGHVDDGAPSTSTVGAHVLESQQGAQNQSCLENNHKRSCSFKICNEAYRILIEDAYWGVILIALFNSKSRLGRKTVFSIHYVLKLVNMFFRITLFESWRLMYV